MNKKISALAGIAAGAAVFAGELFHIHYDLMGRENHKFRSVLALFEQAPSENQPDRVALNIEKNLRWAKNQPVEKLYLQSDRGERLAGWLTYPDEKSDVFVVFAHGHHTDHNGDPANFIKYYVEKGFNFLAMDHVACGESQGRYCGFDLFESADCLKWIDYLIERFGTDIKIIIHGVSMGGSTVCQMVSRIPCQVRFAVADCPFAGALDEFADAARNAGVKLPGFIINAFNGINKLTAGFDLKDTDVRNSVSRSKVPMLFVHGDRDGLIPIESCLELYDLCNSEKYMLTVGGADHAQSVVVNPESYFKKLNEYIEKYI